MWKEIVLWLFVINLGVAFGAELYEAGVVIRSVGELAHHGVLISIKDLSKTLWLLSIK